MANKQNFVSTLSEVANFCPAALNDTASGRGGEGLNGAEVMFFICSLFSASSSPSSLLHVLSLRPPHPFQSLPLSTTTHPPGAATWHAMELNRDEGEVVVRRALQESKIVCFYFCHLRFTTGSSTLRRRRQRVALPWQWSVALTNLQDVPLNVALVEKVLAR